MRPTLRLTLASLACLAAGAIALAAPTARLRLNLSPSLPRGLYRLLPADALVPGQLVLACPPADFARLALARGYLPPGPCPGGSQPLGKLLLAVAGDRLQVTPAGIALDGIVLPSTASAATDRAGRPLPHWAGPHRVAPGTLWLISPHPRSLDSRYFGPVACARILGRLQPLATATGADPLPLAAAIRNAHAGALDDLDALHGLHDLHDLHGRHSLHNP
jgi:conjugative transfer signal peptidase TraF